MFVAIEGADANGKATQSKLTCEKLGGEKSRCALISFPRYETPLGKGILRHLKREIVVKCSDGEDAVEDPMVFQCMMTIDKYHAANEIRKHQAAGIHVVCDRWRQSAEMYGQADGLDPKWLNEIHASLPVADVNIYLEVTLEESLRRRPVLRDRYEKDPEKQKLIRKLYREHWKRKIADGAVGLWAIVDGMRSVAEVNSEIMSLIARRMTR
jgi:dTMP kinase